jgi:ppGpp synthetase/RelA/SpoT-type nucleotidyltranferase
LGQKQLSFKFLDSNRDFIRNFEQKGNWIMADKKAPSSEEYRAQIEAYLRERDAYRTYANAMKRVLEGACGVSIPEAIVQGRAKEVSSFAGKWVRKYEKYPDPIHDMNDLCGARVIVQTLEQVKAVCLFIELNFEILDKDDKGLLLGESAFGYRDIHYLVRVNAERAELIGFEPEEWNAIGNRTAEVQVRTWVQHAWADTLHDRIYKAPLRLSGENKRTGALLAAIMEDGDRAFDRLARELDGMAANYTAYAGRDDVQKEVEAQELMLKNEPDQSAKKPIYALQLSNLIAPGGDFERVVELLDPWKEHQGPIRSELLSELGYALCKKYRGQPGSPEYRHGQNHLEKAIELVTRPDVKAVPNLRKENSLHARAHFRLAWSWEAVPGAEVKALKHYRQAVEIEPGNPYYLAGQLSFEIYCSRSASLIQAMHSVVLSAIKACESHALAGTELPYALFIAGRLCLLLDKGAASLGFYARGLHELFSGTSCAPADLLKEEMEWLMRISFGTPPSENQRWTRELISVAQSFQEKCVEKEIAPKPKRTVTIPKALIVAGGAASMETEILENVKPLLVAALKDFHGIVVSGGTRSGVPGCVGEVCAQLRAENSKGFTLIGYLPRYLPNDAPKDDRYDNLFEVGKEGSFSAGQILRNWTDFLSKGIEPEEVLLLGFGGGTISAIEYRIALAMGATVALVESSGGEADRLLADPLWTGLKNLFPVPMDRASVRAFVSPATREYKRLEEMATAFHEVYVEGSTSRLPANMRPWPDLEETYKKSNREQAKYAVEILRAVGFDVRPVEGEVAPFKSFSQEEIECMAALEHGRWNIERLKDGWRPGKKRDDSNKIHNCLVPWEELPEDVKKYDRNAVRAFPEILAKAGLEVYRLPDQEARLKGIQDLLASPPVHPIS